mmetsp:Transcript_4531/g.11667  ORF Transcript_4531/g.11667 Transcript_4531/m.11667 type:complete len:259 (+) Transcript_4531:209-985(+)
MGCMMLRSVTALASPSFAGHRQGHPQPGAGGVRRGVPAAVSARDGGEPPARAAALPRVPAHPAGVVVVPLPHAQAGLVHHRAAARSPRCARVRAPREGRRGRHSRPHHVRGGGRRHALGRGPRGAAVLRDQDVPAGGARDDGEHTVLEPVRADAAQGHDGARGGGGGGGVRAARPRAGPPRGGGHVLHACRAEGEPAQVQRGAGRGARRAEGRRRPVWVRSPARRAHHVLHLGHAPDVRAAGEVPPRPLHAGRRVRPL